MSSKIILQGGGEHARVVLDCLLENNENVVGLFDPKYNGNLFGVPQLGEYDPAFEPDAKVIIAIGDNRTRKRIVSFTTHAYGNAIHSSAILSTRAGIGVGNMILHRTVVQAQTVIGNHVIVNTGAQIDHDCIVGDFVHLAPASILCGTVVIGEGSLVGAGAVVRPGVKIGAWATIGIGAVVVKDVPDFAVVVGNPGKIIKYSHA